MTDTHGGNGLDVARRLGISRDSLLDLSSNTFLACSAITRAVVAAEPYLHEHYPDPACCRLREAVARHEGLSPERVLPGNGAAELIWLCIAAFRPRRVVMLGPMFSEYTRACTALGVPYTVITPCAPDFAPSRHDLHQLEQADADMAVICLPNNPGGICYSNLPELFQALGARVILADLSYREFLHGTPDYPRTAYRELADLCAPQADLVGLHSLTKFFCCPGVRLGYALASEATIVRLRRCQPAWMVSDFAGAVGARLLERVDAFRARLPDLRAWREQMLCTLAATGVFRPNALLPGPSFVSARLPEGRDGRDGPDAATMRDCLAERGVLVRACDTIPGMAPGFIRMQVRAPEELEPLYQALRVIAGLSF